MNIKGRMPYVVMFFFFVLFFMFILYGIFIYNDSVQGGILGAKVVKGESLPAGCFQEFSRSSNRYFKVYCWDGRQWQYGMDGSYISGNNTPYLLLGLMLVASGLLSYAIVYVVRRKWIRAENSN